MMWIKFTNKNNFCVWLQQMKDLLTQRGILKALHSTEKKPDKMEKVSDAKGPVWFF